MNFGIIIVIAIAGLWALGVFLGVIGGLSKPFTQNHAAMDSSSIKAQEQQTIEDTEAKRQKMMDDVKQKIQDMSQNVGHPP
jgi:ABC-type lipoprotein release transport system permease subunit